MRIIANENFPGDAVNALQQAGHDVMWIRTDAPGSKDHDILAIAENEQRLVVTFDKDFGELAFRYGLSAQCGVILFRISPLSPAFIVQFIVQAVNSMDDWSGHFAVVEPDCIRIRPLTNS